MHDGYAELRFFFILNSVVYQYIDFPCMNTILSRLYILACNEKLKPFIIGKNFKALEDGMVLCDEYDRIVAINSCKYGIKILGDFIAWLYV